jgi:glucose/arabinose dehydrogenase
MGAAALVWAWIALASPTARCVEVEHDFGPKGSTPLRAEVVAQGLEVPWSIGFLPGDALLVTERPGRVRLIEKGALVPEPVATLMPSRHGEGGLLGLAVSPNFAHDRAIFLYVTGDPQVNRVERWKLSPDARHATFERVILDGIPGAEFHDGGRLRFGPDGMLYVGTGDGRVPERSRDWSSLSGKLLRITPDGAVPADNPRKGNPAFVVGIRNTEGFDWLTPTLLVIVDHGPSGELMRTGHDEVNVARPGDDLGWPQAWGCEARAGMVSPLLTWKEAVPPGGAALYTGTRIPGWQGNLVIGTLKSKHLARVVLDVDALSVVQHEVYFEGDPPMGWGRLRDVVMGPDGELYVTTSNCDGRGTCPKERDAVLRIVPAR